MQGCGVSQVGGVRMKSSVFTRRNVPLLLSLVVFIIGMFLPAYYQNLPDDPAPNSFGLLWMGWGGLITGNFEWLANPILLLSWLAALGKDVATTLISAALSVLLIASFLRRTEVVYPTDNDARHALIQAHGPGYWLWLASAA